MSTHLNNDLNKRLKPLYIAGFFQGFVLWYAIEKLFMTSIGFNSQSIAVATVIYILVMLIVNIPFGILADRWSRKGVLCIASLAMVICCLICGLSHSFWVFVVGICFWGIFYACYSGTYDSVIYDTIVEETGRGDGFEKYYGRSSLYDSIALIVGSLLSGSIGSYFGLRADYFLTVPLALASLLALRSFKEPQLHKQKVTALFSSHVRATLKAVIHKGDMFWIVLSLVFAGVGMRLIFEFSQLWLIALLLPVVLFGPAEAVVQAAIGLSGLVTHRLNNNRTKIMLVGLGIVVCSFVLLIKQSLTVILAQGLILTGFYILNIVLSRYLHDSMSSDIRAGASSIVTTISYIVFIPVALVFGYVSKHHSVFGASWLVVGVALVTFMGLIVVMKSRSSIASKAPF